MQKNPAKHRQKMSNRDKFQKRQKDTWLNTEPKIDK